MSKNIDTPTHNLALETFPHLFLHCQFFGKSDTLFTVGWVSARSSLLCMRITSINLVLLVAVALKRANPLCIWYGMLLCGKYQIWKERNNMIFNGKNCSTYQLINKIKSLSFVWLKVKIINLSFKYHVWWLSLFTMLDIG